MSDQTGFVFAFSPQQYVVITAYDLHVKGRILRCVLDRGGDKYEVEYCLNADIKRCEFFADELRAG